MENETKPQLFIMDEQLGNPIPLAEIKEISEPTLDEEYDMPDISHLKESEHRKSTLPQRTMAGF